jgi:hypothetical protein
MHIRAIRGNFYGAIYILDIYGLKMVRPSFEQLFSSLIQKPFRAL